jgi:hypothetical protein
MPIRDGGRQAPEARASSMSPSDLWRRLIDALLTEEGIQPTHAWHHIAKQKTVRIYAIIVHLHRRDRWRWAESAYLTVSPRSIRTDQKRPDGEIFGGHGVSDHVPLFRQAHRFQGSHPHLQNVRVTNVAHHGWRNHHVPQGPVGEVARVVLAGLRVETQVSNVALGVDVGVVAQRATQPV